MTDEPTRRLFPERTADVPGSPSTEVADGGFSGVPERPSIRPDSFSERELPTLASPSSMTTRTPFSSDERVKDLGDRISSSKQIWRMSIPSWSICRTRLVPSRLGAAQREWEGTCLGRLDCSNGHPWMMLRLRAGSL